MRSATVIERAESNFSAYVTDLPGCVATSATVKEVETQIREAIEIRQEKTRKAGAKRRRFLCGLGANDLTTVLNALPQ